MLAAGNASVILQVYQYIFLLLLLFGQFEVEFETGWVLCYVEKHHTIRVF